MKRVVVQVGLMFALSRGAAAETFDITTYTPPADWTRQDVTGTRGFTKVDQAAGTFCRIALHASMATLGSSKADFDADWRELIVKPFKPTAEPTVQDGEERGWKVRSGSAPFTWDKRPAMAVLVMATGASKRFAISYVATGDCAEQFGALISSLQLEPSGAPGVTSDAPAAATTAGWSVAAHADFVEARQDKLVVRLHFATPIPDALRGDAEAKRDHFWSTFVAPRYAEVKNVRKPRIEAYAASEMMEADARDLGTKQNVHIAFHMFTENGVVSAVEVVAPSKAALDAAYGDGDKVSTLRDLNRFAVTAKDLPGTWHRSSGAFAQYYNVYTGAGVGVFAASSYKITFTDKAFKSELKAVGGRTGSPGFAKETEQGSWKLDGGTLVTKSKTAQRTHDAWFEVVRGGRILHLVDQKKTAMHDKLVRQN